MIWTLHSSVSSIWSSIFSTLPLKLSLAVSLVFDSFSFCWDKFSEESEILYASFWEDAKTGLIFGSDIFVDTVLSIDSLDSLFEIFTSVIFEKASFCFSEESEILWTSFWEDSFLGFLSCL